MIGWAAAAVLAVVVLELRRRLELVARAEHELRGPLTAFSLAAESARRGRPVGGALDSELERARVALADLTSARRGRRAAPARCRVELEPLVRSSAVAWGARLDWRAGGAPVEADAGRVAQALGNVLANAAEHGDGPVLVRVTRAGGARRVRVEVANAERGRGLAIASLAARDAGGSLAVQRGGGQVRATLDLPLAT